MVDQPHSTEMPAAHGRLDARFTAKNGDEFIVEFNHFNEYKSQKDRARDQPSKDGRMPNESGQEIKPKVSHPPPPNEDDAESTARLREAMDPLAQKALEQIATRCAPKFASGASRVVMVAIVVARRTFVMAQFKTLPATKV